MSSRLDFCGLVGRFGAGFGHEFFGGSDGLVGGDFRPGFIDVVNVEGAINKNDGGAGFGAGAFVLVNVLGREEVVIAADKDDRLFVFHVHLQEAGERDYVFIDAMPVPGNDAAGCELDFNDRGGGVGIAFENGKGGAVGNAVNGRIRLVRSFAEDGFISHFLGGEDESEENQKKGSEKKFFHRRLQR